MFLLYILMTPLIVMEYVNPKSPPIIIHHSSVSINVAFIMQKFGILWWLQVAKQLEMA
jgi:hypothetical protein